MVIAIIPHGLVVKPKVKVNKEEGLIEIIGYYKARKGSLWSNYRNYQRVQTLVLQKLLDLEFLPDAIVCHVGEKSIGLAKKYFRSIPRIVVEHWSGFINGNFDQLSPKKQKQRIAEINSCKKCVVVSQPLKDALVRFGVSIPISIIPNVIDQGKKKEHFNSPPKFLVVADLVDEIKNISGVIAAVRNLDDTTLTIIGDGTDRTKLEEMARGLKIEFLGRKDNSWVLEHLCDYDILIINSHFETFSMITAEALVCGLPVISTKCGGPEQFITNGINGWLVNTNDTPALSQTIILAKEEIVNMSPDIIIASILPKIDHNMIQEEFKAIWS